METMEAAMSVETLSSELAEQLEGRRAVQARAQEASVRMHAFSAKIVLLSGC